MAKKKPSKATATVARRARTRKAPARNAVTRKAATRKVASPARQTGTSPSARLPKRSTGARTAKAKAGAARAAKAGAHATPTSRGDRVGKYVYCIIRSDRPLEFGPIGIGDGPAPVYTVVWRDLAAVVSDSPLAVLDPTRRNVLAHQRVNETVMEAHTVLPTSFGTVFKTRDDVLAFLRSASDAFSDVLDKMANKLEFGLKVLWNRDAVIAEIEREDEDIRRLKSEIASQKGSTYFARMQYGRLVDSALQNKSAQYVAEIFDRLRTVSVAARANKPIGDRMILNAAFLISRDKEAAFDARVKELGARHGKLTFRYTGPWPPYNFINIRLKLERA